jgi:hypothetical protein
MGLNGMLELEVIKVEAQMGKSEESGGNSEQENL